MLKLQKVWSDLKQQVRHLGIRAGSDLQEAIRNYEHRSAAVAALPSRDGGDRRDKKSLNL
jgi:hypothetical protein